MEQVYLYILYMFRYIPNRIPNTDLVPFWQYPYPSSMEFPMSLATMPPRAMLPTTSLHGPRSLPEPVMYSVRQILLYHGAGDEHAVIVR